MNRRTEARSGTDPASVAIIAGQLVMGGAERQLLLWLSGMDRGLFSPVLVTLHPGEGDYWEPSVESLGIPLIRVGRRMNRAARVLEIVRGLRPFRPRLVHAWHLFASPYGAAASRILGADACLGSLRGSYESFQRSRLQSRLTLAFVDGLLVNSQAAGDRVARGQGKRSTRIFVVPNAVENHFCDRSTARRELCGRFGLNDQELWIGSMGRIEKAKRFDLLLDLTASLLRSGERVRLLVIGDGPELPSLREHARGLRLGEAVVFTGAQPEARTWLNALDIFCFPSPDEGLPNVVMEAAAAGVPVVAWKTPALAELLEDGVSGLLAPPEDTRRLEDAVRGLVHDAGRRQALGSAARMNILGQFSVARFLERMTGAYTALLEGAPRGRGMS